MFERYCKFCIRTTQAHRWMRWPLAAILLLFYGCLTAMELAQEAKGKLHRSMLRRAVSGAVAVCMVISMLPMAHAEEVAPESTDAIPEVSAEEGDAESTAEPASTLPEAVDGNITLTENVVLTESYVVGEGTTLTINLNGWTITGTGLDAAGGKAHVIVNNGNLTISGGTVKSTATNGGSAIYNYGILALEKVDVVGAPTDTAAGTASYALNSAGANSQVTITDSNISGRGAIGATDGTEVVVNGGSYHTPAVAWGHAVYADDEGTKVTINDGIFTEGYEYNNTNWGMYQICSMNKAKVTVNGGDFSERWDCANGYDLHTATDGVIEIKGGTFAENPSSQNDKNYVVTGYKVTESDSGYTVAMDPDMKVTNSKGAYATLAEAVSAAESGDTITLLADIETSDTLTIPDNKTITLDLNGKKISATDTKPSGNYELFYNYGGLTVTGNGTIELTATTDRDWNAASSIFHNRGGVLIIENGTFIHNGGSDMAYVVDNSGNSYGDAELTVKSGTLKSTYIAVRMRMDKIPENGDPGNGASIVSIEDGYLYGTSRAVWGQISSAGNNKGSLSVTGGILECVGENPRAIDIGRSTEAQNITVTIADDAVIKGNILAEESVLSITGGTITGEVMIYTGAGEAVAASPVITGGTFSSNPTGYVASDKIVKKNSDTAYVVVAKSGLTAGTYMDDPSGATATYYYVTNNNDGTWTVYYQAPAPAPDYSDDYSGSSSSSTTTTPTAPSVPESSKPNVSAPTTSTETKTDTTTGSTTTTETKQDGTKVETTTNKDGSSSTTASKTETTTNKDGSTTTTTATNTSTTTATGDKVTEEKVEAKVENKDGSTTTTTATNTTTQTAAGDKVTEEKVEKVEENKDGSTTTTTTTKTETQTASGEKVTVKAEEKVEATETKTTTTTTTETKSSETGLTVTEKKVAETVKDETGKEVTTSKTETKSSDGSKSTTTVDETGKTTAEVTVSATAVNTAANKETTVTLPMPAVETTKATETAPEVKVSVPASAESVKVEIPVAEMTAGTVAVIVHADGTEEVVKTSAVTDKGVALTLEGNATIKVVDNSKDFHDVSDDYALSDSIDFVSARGLFEGKTETIFNPHEDTSVAQTLTVLARLDGEDFYGAGSTAKGTEWGTEMGLHDGADANKPVTREGMAVMLWKMAGSPKSGKALTAADADKVSADALEAMMWAVEQGIFKGNLDGTLNPTGNASRAHVAAFAERYVNAI